MTLVESYYLPSTGSNVASMYVMHSSDQDAENWSLERLEVSKIALTVLMTRCEYILKRFVIDEKDLGGYLMIPNHDLDLA